MRAQSELASPFKIHKKAYRATYGHCERCKSTQEDTQIHNGTKTNVSGTLCNGQHPGAENGCWPSICLKCRQKSVCFRVLSVA